MNTSIIPFSGIRLLPSLLLSGLFFLLSANVLAQVNADFTVSSATVCSGSTVTFTNASTGTSDTTSYSWDFGTGASPATANTIGPHIVTYTGSGTSTVSLTVVENSVTNTETKAAYITVNALPTANAGPALPAICQGTTSAPLGGSVGGSATGGTWSSSAGGTFSPDANTLDATWTPPAAYSGTATLTLTTTGSPCGTATANKTQLVNPNAVITLTSAAGTANQSRCINTAIANIRYTISGGGTNGTVSGLPDGVTGSFSAGVFTISGTPTNAGIFNYTVNTTGTCAQTSASGTITVNPNAAIVLTSAAGTNTQSLCINTPITSITYSVTGGGTGAGVTGLPDGITGSFSAGVFTISGTPTAAGTFNYTVTTTGTCVQTNAAGTITVIALPTANAGSALTAICQGTASAPLGGSVGGSATGGTWSSSAGGTFSPNANTLNATWTPPAAYSGTATLTLTTTGSPCGTATANKTQLVNPNAVITLTSAGGTTNQSRCINTAIANITYTITGGGTGGTVSGLPDGVTGSFSAGVFTISGTPTNAGIFNYTVNTTGTCTQTSASGTITVNPNAAIALTSTIGTNIQSRCINTPITSITYTITGGGTGGTVSGLPAGVTGSFSAGVFTISGTPTAAGTFNYTVTTTGTCVQANAAGTITVIALPTANAGSALTAICQGSTSAALGGSVGGSATGGTWSSSAGGTFSPNANTLNATWTPPAAYSGTATLTLTATGSPCGTATATKTQLVNPNAVITLTSAAGTTNQSRCINTAIANITYAITGGGTGGTVSGLPAGVTGSFSAGVFTISGTPTVSGTFNYTVNTTGTCTQTSASGTITVNPNAAIALTSAIGTNIQSRCINTPITSITYAVTGGGTGAGVTGLPAGVTGSFSAGVFTISGTPTAAGTFNYTVSTTGTCVQANATGTITVIPLPTANAGPALTAICQGTASAPLGGSVGGSATGGTWSSSAGGTFSPNANTLNATWTPPAAYSGTATLTLTTTGSPCGTTTATKTQLVNPNAVITLTSAGGTTNQSRCINTAITNITYAITGGGTGGTVSGLPAGVTGSFSAGVFTISGTPTVSGTFNYTVNSTGTCTQTSASGTITVNPLPLVTAANNGPVCIASPLSLTGGPAGMSSYAWTGPNGFSSSLQSPAVSPAATSAMAGVYTLTVINNNGCINAATTSVTVNPLPVATASNNSPICAGTSLSLSGGPAGMASYAWTGPGGYNASVRNPVVSTSATVAMSGTYNLVIRDNNGCQGSASTSATVNPLPTATISGNTAVCKDSPSPDITFTGTGGTPPYTFTYRINTGGSQTISTTIGNSVSLQAPTGTAGVFTYSLISVRDDNTLCLNPQTESAVVTVNPLPSASISGTTSVCEDAASPLITFIGSNGTRPYTFSYSVNSGATQTVSTTAGNNSVSVPVPTANPGIFTYALSSVTDNSSTACSQLAGGTATVTVNALPTATINGTTAVCQDTPSPNVTFTGSSGIAPYTFTYTVNGGSAQTVATSGGNTISVPVPTGTPGSYTYALVSVRDASSTLCSQTQEGSATVTVNPRPNATIAGTTSVCKDAGFPVITFTGSNGTAPYTFTYTINSGSNQLVSTSGGNTATVQVPTGTPGVFTYSLVSVSDASSTICSRTVSGSATITINTLPTATINGTTTVCQNGSPPPVLFTGANGTSPYTFTYHINGGSELTVSTAAGNNSVTVPAPTGSAGIFTYTLVSVQDASSSACIQAQSGTATITVNPLPTATISGNTSVCQNAPQPNIRFTGANASPPYTFSYTINGGSEFTVTTTSGSSVQVPVPTGTAGTFVYSLTGVRDGSSTACLNTASGSATVTVNPLPVTSAIFGNQTPACKAEGVSYMVNLTAGSSYAWSVPSEAVITSGATGPNNYRISVNFGAFNGNVSVIETLPTGCSGAQVNLPIGLQGCDLNADFTASNTSVCDGSSVVFSDLSTGVSGATTYAWDFGIDSDPPTATGAGPHTVLYKGTGNRTVSLTITDGASNTEIKENYITVNPLPTATITGNRVVCQNSASPLITFTGASGTAPYTFTYAVNAGSPQTITTPGGNSVSLPVPTSNPGQFIYTLISVRDASASACTQPQTGTATVRVNPLPTATIEGSTEVCSGTASPLITFTGASGTAPYTFTYYVNEGNNQTISSAPGNNSVTLAVPTASAGTFTFNLVSVRDASSTTCGQSQTGTAVVRVNPLPTATISGSTEVCQNGASPNITFLGSSGTPPYTFSYRINGGTVQTVTSTVGNSVTVAAPTGTAGTFVYTLVGVSDNSSTFCAQNQGGSATVIVNPLPDAEITGTTAVCKDAPFPLVTFSGSNGTSPYTFTYRVNGGGNQTITTPDGNNSVALPVPTGIAGTFTYTLVSVRDASSTNCVRLQSGSAVITVNPLPTATINGTTAVCMNAVSPLITFTGSNGTAPYTFSYTINSGNVLTVATTSGNSVSIPVPTENTGTFTYSLVSVSDNSSTMCSQTQSGGATVVVNPLPAATISGTTSVCRDGMPPNITFTGANGTAPYTFTYRINDGNNLTIVSTSGNSATIQVPTSTSGVFTYSLVSVKDASSTACVQTQEGSAVITVNPLPTASISGTTAVCMLAPSPEITFTGENGTAPYTFRYTINSGNILTVISNAGGSADVPVPTGSAGTFTYSLVSVRDSSSTACTQLQTGSATVTVNPLPTATISGGTEVCRNSPSPGVFFTGENGTAPYTFTYRVNGGTPQSVTSTGTNNSISIPAPTGTAGTFTYSLVSVRDASSTTCLNPQSGNAVIRVNPLPTATIEGTTAVCRNGAFPEIIFTGANGTSPYTFTYQINGGSNLTATTTSGSSVRVPVSTESTGVFTYTLVSVSDGTVTACAQPQEGSATITVNPLPTAEISGTTSVCRNAASPLITFTGNNGTAPYTFSYRINTGTVLTVSTTSGNSVTVPAPTGTVGTFTYTLLSVRDASSSSCLQAVVGASAMITVNPLPTANISGTTSVCRNSPSPNITFTGAGGTPPYTFQYRINGGSIQTVSTTSLNSISVPVPTGTTGTYVYSLVSVRDGSSTSCLNNQTEEATITVNPLPVTSGISGNQTPACEATGMVYSVSLTPGSSYTWTVPPGSTITGGATGPENNSITVDFGTTNGNITVRETLPTGCSGALVSLPISLQGCALDANFEASSTIICNGAGLIFTDLSTGVTGATTYSWNFGTGASPSTATGAGPHAVSYTGTGLKTIRLTITEGASDTETKTNYIRVNPLPAATIAGGTTVCRNAPSPNVTFTGSNGTPPYTFSYRVNGGNIQTITTISGSSISITAPTGTPGAYTYSLVSVSDGSVSNCSQGASGSTVINVNPLPTATINGSTAVCRFASPPLVTFSGDGGTAPYTFTYNLNGGGSQTITTTGTNSSITLPVATGETGTYTYTLLSVKDGSSTACTQAQEGMAVVTVNPLPAATISGTTIVCKDAPSPNITFTGENGTAPYTFTYTINSGIERTVTTAVGSTATVSVPTGSTGTFTYSLIRVSDSSPTACVQSSGGTATVIVNPLPTATVTGTTSVCRDAASPLVTFTGAGGTAPYSFTYNINGGINQTVTATGVNSSVSLPAPTGIAGTFTYTLVGVRDASSTACYQVVEGEAVVITVNPLPIAEISGTTTVCRNSASPNVTFTGSNGTAPYTFTYTINSGNEQTVTTSAGNSISVPVPTGTAGSYTYALIRVRDGSNTSCVQAASGSVTVTVNPLPTATIAGGTEVCRDAPSPLITFTGAGGTAPYTFTYRINGGNIQTITTTGGNSISIAASTATAGTFTYSLVSVRDASSTACVQAQTSSVAIQVNPLPTATINGSTEVCRNSPTPEIIFTGVTGTAPFTFTYSLNGGSNRTVSTTSGNSVSVPVSTADTGTFTYTLRSVRDGSVTSCFQPQSDSATVRVNPLPTATIGGTRQVCRNDPSPNILFTGSGGTPPYTFTYRVNNGSNQNVTTSVGNAISIPVPTGTAGVFTYSLVSVRDASASACSQAVDQNAVITVYTIPTANAGAGGDECDLDFQFSAVPSVGTGTWTRTSGPGNAIFLPDANSPDATVTVSEYGSYTFTWTEQNGTCSTSSTVDVNFYLQPVANPGTGGSSCDLNFQLGAVPGTGTGSWSLSSGPGRATFTPDNTTPDAEVSVSDTGTYVFTWTEVNASCSNSADVSVIFYEQPVADAGTGGNNCGLEYTLQAGPGIGIGTWSLTSGAGTASFSPDANDPLARVSVTEFGSHTFTWTLVNGTCSDNASVEVNFIDAPISDAGTGGESCSLEFNLNAAGDSIPGTWSLFNGPGNASFSPSVTYPDALVTVDEYGIYDFAWTVENIACTSFSTARVIFREQPLVSAGVDTIMCIGDIIELSGQGTGTFLWSPDTLVNNPVIANPLTSPEETMVFTLQLTDEYGCVNTDEVLVVVRDNPVANAGPDQLLDFWFNTTLDASLEHEYETGIWSLVSGTGEVTDTLNPKSQLYGLALGENIFRWTVTNEVCPPVNDLVSITVNDLIVPTLITPNYDGKNDYFVLRGIENLGRTEIVVFDRRGTMVYKNSNYENDWDGVDNRGNALPDDTYFIVVETESGRKISGYLVVRR